MAEEEVPGVVPELEATIRADVDRFEPKLAQERDSASAATIVARARQSRIPVVSYDRLVVAAPVDYYVSFDNEQVGRLQGQALIDRLAADGKGDGTIVMINGSPTDNNASQFKAGAHAVLDVSGLAIGAEYDTPDWSPDKAQQQMEQALTKLGGDRVAGVYAANDGTAGGAIAAMKAAGIAPLPPVTGQDAELAAIQRRRRAVHDRVQGDPDRGRSRGRARRRARTRHRTGPGHSQRHGRQRRR